MLGSHAFASSVNENAAENECFSVGSDGSAELHSYFLNSLVTPGKHLPRLAKA